MLQMYMDASKPLHFLDRFLFLLGGLLELVYVCTRTSTQ